MSQYLPDFSKGLILSRNFSNPYKLRIKDPSENKNFSKVYKPFFFKDNFSFSIGNGKFMLLNALEILSYGVAYKTGLLGKAFKVLTATKLRTGLTLLVGSGTLVYFKSEKTDKKNIEGEKFEDNKEGTLSDKNHYGKGIAAVITLVSLTALYKYGMFSNVSFSKASLKSIPTTLLNHKWKTLSAVSLLGGISSDNKSRETKDSESTNEKNYKELSFKRAGMIFILGATILKIPTAYAYKRELLTGAKWSVSTINEFGRTWGTPLALLVSSVKISNKLKTINNININNERNSTNERNPKQRQKRQKLESDEINSLSGSDDDRFRGSNSRWRISPSGSRNSWSQGEFLKR